MNPTLDSAHDSEFLKSQEIFNSICDDNNSSSPWDPTNDLSEPFGWKKVKRDNSNSSDEDDDSDARENFPEDETEERREFFHIIFNIILR